MKTYQDSRRSKKRICRVQDCVNSLRHTRDVLFHRIPTEDKLRKKWISVLKMKNITSDTRICTLHFRDSDYVISDQNDTQMVNRLKKGVIPTLNLPRSPLKQEISTHSKDCEDDENMESSNIEEELIDSQVATLKVETIIDYIKTDSQLREFCGIPTFQLLYEIAKGIRSLNMKNVIDFTMPLPHCIMLTFLQLKHNFSLLCLSALFQLDEDICKSYFNQTIKSLRALLYSIIENNPTNGEVIKILMPVNRVKAMQNSVFY